jgi:hypothetical protein
MSPQAFQDALADDPLLGAQLRFDGAVIPHRSIAGRHWGDTARLWQ